MGFRHLFQGKIPTSTSPLTGSSTRVLILGKKDELHIIFAIVFITNRWLIDWQCDWLIGYSRMAEAIKYKRPFRGNAWNIFVWLDWLSYWTVNFFVGIDTVPTSTCTMNVHSTIYKNQIRQKDSHLYWYNVYEHY